MVRATFQLEVTVDLPDGRPAAPYIRGAAVQAVNAALRPSGVILQSEGSLDLDGVGARYRSATLIEHPGSDIPPSGHMLFKGDTK